MTSIQITLKEAIDLDKILAGLVKADDFISPDDVHETLFPEEELSYSESLVEILANYPNLIYESTATALMRFFRKTAYTETFLKKGGFQRFYNDELAKQKEEKEIKQLQIEETKINIALAKKTLKDYPWTKWTARIAFLISLGLAILELIKWLKNKA